MILAHETVNVLNAFDPQKCGKCFYLLILGWWLMISWNVCLPYSAGAITLIIGVTRAARKISTTHGVDRLIMFGPILLAAPASIRPKKVLSRGGLHNRTIPPPNRRGGARDAVNPPRHVSLVCETCLHCDAAERFGTSRNAKPRRTRSQFRT